MLVEHEGDEQISSEIGKQVVEKEICSLWRRFRREGETVLSYGK